jgi:hypothetical protein
MREHTGIGECLDSPDPRSSGAWPRCKAKSSRARTVRLPLRRMLQLTGRSTVLFEADYIDPNGLSAKGEAIRAWSRELAAALSGRIRRLPEGARSPRIVCGG